MDNNNNYNYNRIMLILNTKVNLINYVVNGYDKNNNKKWNSTSKKELTLDKAIKLIKNYNQDINYNNTNRVYTYEGNLDFNLKNKNVRTIRKLLEIEPRLLNNLYNDIKSLHEDFKTEKNKYEKYKKLYELKAEQNTYNKLLIDLQKELDDEEKSWENLNQYHSYPNDDYCELDYFSEDKAKEMETLHYEKTYALKNRMEKIKKELDRLDKMCEEISNRGGY